MLFFYIFKMYDIIKKIGIFGDFMREYIGKVVKVFIKEDESNKICFDVDINDNVITIIENINDSNINIYKDDTVVVNEYEISNNTFRDIRLYGDKNA